MTLPGWQLQTPVSAIIFDCDGTLSSLEGINELAKNNGVQVEVEALTELAMSKTGLNAELYQKRLDLVYPKKNQLLALGEAYFKHSVPDIIDIISLLKRLNKTIYIVSAGLNPAVTIFGEYLSIPKENIYAINVSFDPQGNFLDYDRESPLVTNLGKRHIVSKLKTMHSTMVHIGDGLNDLVTQDLVTRFIGYGGIFYRENLAKLCQYYISTASLAPLLPLCLTEQEYQQLTISEKHLYEMGLNAVNDIRC